MVTSASKNIVPGLITNALAALMLGFSSVPSWAATWATPFNGFYEEATNWTPIGVPPATENVIFRHAGTYSVGLEGNQSANYLTVTEGADISFVVAGADTNNRVYRIRDNTEILNSGLRLHGNEAGPRISLVTEGLDIRGNTEALRVVDNAGILNNSTFADLSADLAVTGTRASWNMSGDLTLRGNSELSVSGGGLVGNLGDAVLGGSSRSDISNGYVSVSGVGTDGQPSTMITGQKMYIGNYGRGRLSVTNGAFVDVGVQTYIGFGADAVGRVVVEGTGPTGNAATLNTGLLSMGRGEEASLTIQDGGLVNSTSASLGDGKSASVDIVGGDRPSAWNLSGVLGVGVTANGTVTVTDGARLQTQYAILGLSGGSTTGRLHIRGESDDHPTTVWENHSDFAVGGNVETSLGRGVFVLTGNAQASIGERFSIWEDGLVHLNGGAKLAADTIDHTNNGTFEFEDATLHVNRFEGDLLNPSGTLAPGVAGPNGLTTILGDYTQQRDATLSISIGGTAPGSQHDLVNVSGDTLLDGLLELSLTEDYLPEASNSFTILAAESLLGVFDNVLTGQRLDTVDGRGSFVVNYGVGSPFAEDRIVLSDFLSTTLLGDFNMNGTLDADDIDLLTAALGGTDMSFDLTADGTIDQHDRTRWVEELSGTYFGDANLDGEFNSGDFVHVFQRGEYEDSIVANSGWADGDWNGDGEFDSGDFVLAFQSGGYENGPRMSLANVASVPEPSSYASLLVGFGIFAIRVGRSA